MQYIEIQETTEPKFRTSSKLKQISQSNRDKASKGISFKLCFSREVESAGDDMKMIGCCIHSAQESI